MRWRTASTVFALAASACVQSVDTDQQDGGSAVNAGENCEQLITCLNACSTQDCATGCESMGSLAAQQALSALSACIDGACSSSGVCATNSTACNTCLQNAQEQGGACADELTACEDQSSPGGDAGTSTAFGCGGINNCLNACASGDDNCQQNCFDDGTMSAQTLFNDQNTCFNDTCPDSPGDVCATSTPECETCALTAEALDGGCNSAIVACDTDMSGTGSAATPPGTGCNALVGCLQACDSSEFTCEDACQAATTLNGLELLNTLDTCLFVTACPSTGVCSTDSTDCESCLSAAQTTGGACSTDYFDCSSD